MCSDAIHYFNKEQKQVTVLCQVLALNPDIIIFEVRKHVQFNAFNW